MYLTGLFVSTLKPSRPGVAMQKGIPRFGVGGRTALPHSEAHAAEWKPQLKNQTENMSMWGASGGKGWGGEGPDT